MSRWFPFRIFVFLKRRHTWGFNSPDHHDFVAGEKDEPAPDTLKQVELKVPWTPDLKCTWSFPCKLLSLPARLFRFTLHRVPSLWMFSVCLAEIEKHKGNAIYQTITVLIISMKDGSVLF